VCAGCAAEVCCQQLPPVIAAKYMPTAVLCLAADPAAGAGGLCPVRDLRWGSEQQPIAAVLVCSDPTGSDWYQVRARDKTCCHLG
jgi:hypothetical protein